MASKKLAKRRKKGTRSGLLEKTLTLYKIHKSPAPSHSPPAAVAAGNGREGLRWALDLRLKEGGRRERHQARTGKADQQENMPTRKVAQPDQRRNGSAAQSRAPCFSASATAPMAGGGGRDRGDGRKPAKSSSSSSSSRQRKPRASREFGRESSLESQKEGPCSSSPSVSSKKPLPQTPVQPPISPVSLSPPKMAAGSGGERKPVTSSSSWQWKAQVLHEFGHERSLDSQKEGSCSSSPSVSSKKSPPQMVTLVQPPESLESPSQMVTPLQPPKSLDSPPQTVTPVQPPGSLESLVQRVGSLQLSKSPESNSASSGTGAVGPGLGAATFDICMSNSKGLFKLNPPLHKTNKEKRLRAKELSNSAAPLHLGPGMVLLKNYLKQTDQVKIIKLCRDLGVGPGGFYQPAYKEGARLSLRMMCLGKNWDPDSSKYGDIRHFDGAQPPKIPEELTEFVKNAIDKSHEFLKEEGSSKPSSELPLMSPDICIVNFYTTTGKLGLHQDKDETKSSLNRGLPVVSFSLGDTAEFLYSNVRDEAKASKVNLESGDVLIFGGQSRHMFHGVSSIAPKTAPNWVSNEANLRPGRLNLTFREY